MSNHNFQEKLNTILNEGFSIGMGDKISDGFKLLNKNMANFVVFTLIYFAIVFLASMIPFLGQLVSIIIVPPLTVGFFLAARKTELEGNAEINYFFKGFDYIGPLILRSLTTLGISIVAMIPFFLAVFQTGFFQWFLELNNNPTDPTILESFPGIPFWAFLCLIPLIYLSIAYSFADLFIVFNKLHFWDAMEASRKLITKRWFAFFICFLVFGLIAALGFLACGVGILFTFPAYTCMMYLLFASVTRLEEDEDQIDDHLII
ncbi:MAG: BPSS1780 family membrane protein [Saprospiraceae bacterium]